MENDMPARQQPQPISPLNVSRIAVGIAVILFFIGLFLYVSSSPELNPAAVEPQQPEAVAPTNAPSPQAKRVEGQVIVKFKAGITDQQINERLKPLNASIKSKIEGINTTVLNVPPGQEDAVLKALEGDPIVQYAEPDYIYYLEAVPNDPQFVNQWGLMNTGQSVNNKAGKADADIDAELAWDVTKGAGVTVAILDAGIDTNHPEFAGRIVGSKSFTLAGVADKNGHGTHVAGILAAAANNGQGISGICPECKLLIGKITNDDAAGTVPASAIAPSIIWAADSGAKVINMSIAGPSFSQAVQDAVNNAWGKNVVIVSASGNNGSSTKSYPGAYTNVVSVANTNSSDTKSSTSNYGTWVLIAAPGDKIYSTLPTTENFVGSTSFGYLNGTSMASPLVAGTAALVWTTSFGTSNAAVVQRLLSTADKITGTGTQWVHGRLNAAKAVGAGATPPSAAPSAIVSVTPSTVTPPFVCGGSTNSICITPEPSIPGVTQGTNYSTSGAPTQAVNPTVPGASPYEPEVSPPQTPGTNPPPGEHKKPVEGGIGRFVALLISIIIIFFKFLFGVFGH